MLKTTVHSVIFKLFKRLARDGLEYCDIKVTIRGRDEGLHVYVTKNWKEEEEPEELNRELDASKYLI